MGSFSIWHWLVVLVIVVLIFGTSKLKNMGKDLGGAVKGFKEGMKQSRLRLLKRKLKTLLTLKQLKRKKLNLEVLSYARFQHGRDRPYRCGSSCGARA